MRVYSGLVTASEQVLGNSACLFRFATKGVVVTIHKYLNILTKLIILYTAFLVIITN